MKVYFINKKMMLGAVVALLLISGFWGISLFYSKPGIASRMNEPIYQGNTGKKVVAITVNVDWGEEFIPAMLEEFEKHEVKVTFFVTGIWAEKNREMLKIMAESGHSIQNHGYKHVHFNNLSNEDAKSQIKKAEEVIFKTIDKKSEFFASPYGEQNRSLMRAVSDINYDLIMWSIDTIDWQRPSPDVIVKRVLNKLHNDAIILMHPTEPTVLALPTMLKGISDEGYKMVTINEIVMEASEEDNKDDAQK